MRKFPSDGETKVGKIKRKENVCGRWPQLTLQLCGVNQQISSFSGGLVEAAFILQVFHVAFVDLDIFPLVGLKTQMADICFTVKQCVTVTV